MNRRKGPETDSVAELLDHLRLQGQVESIGDFTVDISKLHEKLGSYQMEAAHHFALPFVSVATMSDATLVNFQGSFERLNINFDGRTFSLEELQACLQGSEGRTEELEVGIKFALSAGATELQVVSGDDEFLNVLHLKGGEPEFYRAPKPQKKFVDQTRVRIRGCKVSDSAPTPYEFLCQRCGFSPIIAWKGMRIRNSRSKATCALLRFQTSGGEDPSISAMSWINETSTHKDFTGQIWLEDEELSEIQFLLNGVAYPTSVTFSQYPGLQGVVSYPKAKLDLSRSSVVLDKHVEAMLGDIEKQFEEIVFPQLVRNYRGMLPYQKRIAKKFLTLWYPNCGDDIRPRLERMLGTKHSNTPHPA